MPPIDVVLVTHDHRDHLDLADARASCPRPRRTSCRSATAPRLATPNVVELDWWQTHAIGALEITLVPARHWSMRDAVEPQRHAVGRLRDRGPEGTAYHSGDTAWGDHFAEIGARSRDRLGDAADRRLRAALVHGAAAHRSRRGGARRSPTLGAKHLLAMHWGTFRLTDEAVGEPPERLRAYWREHGLPDERLWILDVGEARRLYTSAR